MDSTMKLQGNLIAQNAKCPKFNFLIYPAHACAKGVKQSVLSVCQFVCLFVCLFVVVVLQARLSLPPRESLAHETTERGEDGK